VLPDALFLETAKEAFDEAALLGCIGRDELLAQNVIAAGEMPVEEYDGFWPSNLELLLRSRLAHAIHQFSCGRVEEVIPVLSNIRLLRLYDAATTRVSCERSHQQLSCIPRSSCNRR
jgi:hypothetical protein